MKLLLKLVVLLVLVLVVGAVLVFYSIDRIARAGIERGSTFALGVPVTLASADVGVFDGTFEMKRLNVSNPPDFRTDHFLDLGAGAVAVTLGSLRQDVVELPHLRLEEISINLEKSAGKANYAIITENLKRFEDLIGPSEEGKRFIVHELAIRDVAIHVDLLPLGGELTRANLAIEEIILKDVGSENARGVVMAELVAIIIKSILEAAVDVGGGIIPGDILGELSSQLAQLEDIDAIRTRLSEGVSGALEGALEGVSEQVQDAIDDAAKKAEEEVRRGLEGIGDRLRPR